MSAKDTNELSEQLDSDQNLSEYNSKSYVGRIIIALIVVAVTSIIVLQIQSKNSAFFGELINSFAMQFIGIVIGSLIGAIILRLAVRFALGFKLPYGAAYGATLLSNCACVVVEFAFVVVAVILQRNLDKPGILLLFFIVLSMLTQAIIFGLVIKLPTGKRIGFGAGLGVTFIQMFIIIAIAIVMFVLISILSAVFI